MYLTLQEKNGTVGAHFQIKCNLHIKGGQGKVPWFLSVLYQGLLSVAVGVCEWMWSLCVLTWLMSPPPSMRGLLHSAPTESPRGAAAAPCASGSGSPRFIPRTGLGLALWFCACGFWLAFASMSLLSRSISPRLTGSMMDATSVDINIENALTSFPLVPFFPLLPLLLILLQFTHTDELRSRTAPLICVLLNNYDVPPPRL